MSCGVCAHDLNDNRVVLLFLQFYSEGVNNTAVQVLDSAPLICRPTYSMRTASVSFSDMATGSGDTLTVNNNPTGKPWKLPGLNDSDIFSAFQASLYEAEPLGSSDESKLYTSNDTLISWLVATRNPAGTGKELAWDELLQVDTLKGSAEAIYKSVGAQIASEALLVPSRDQISGVVVSLEDRLVVRQLSLALMEATIAVLLFWTLFMVSLVPKESILPQDPARLQEML
jgi:hypothetical protein